jgi:dTDP-4-amino-4,6-dideoxygalactose transaminase
MSTLAIKGGNPVRTAAFPVWPVFGDKETQALTEVVKSRTWGSLNGKKTTEFEEKYAALQDARHGILLNSGTTALQIALKAADVPAGSEVIVPAYTFIATATAVIEMQCIPIFVDVEPDTFNIDPEKVKEAITDKTAAIMPVHFAGRPANMDEIMAIAGEHRLKVIEDAAQAWGAKWNGRGVGAIGDAGTFSFQSSKNINAGEGGIIVTNDDMVAKMARSHINCGRSDDGMWYEHFYFGGNYRITEFQSAVLLAQLERYPELHKVRLENLQFLNSSLASIPGINLCKDDDRIAHHASHLFVFRYDAKEFNDAPKTRFIEAMREEGIPASPGYPMPLYEQPVFRKKAFGPRGKTIDLPVDYASFDCPVSDRLCKDEGIWFTQNTLLGSTKDMQDIVDAITKISEHSDEL